MTYDDLRLATFKGDRHTVSINRDATRLRITERIPDMPGETYADMTPAEWMQAAGAWAEKTAQLYKQTETRDYLLLGQKAAGRKWRVLYYGLTKTEADTEGRKWANKGFTRQYRVVRVYEGLNLTA